MAASFSEIMLPTFSEVTHNGPAEELLANGGGGGHLGQLPGHLAPGLCLCEDILHSHQVQHQGG
eukprot:2796508-Lingulodinium_polyedra.AAC.1